MESKETHPEHAALGAGPSALPHPEEEPWERNPLHTFDELLDHLLAQANRADDPSNERSTLDLLFTASALTQILDDHLHRGFLGVRLKVELAIGRPEKLDRYLGFLPKFCRGPFRALLVRGVIGTLATFVDWLAAAGIRNRARFSERSLFSLSQRIHQLASDIAYRRLTKLTTRDLPGVPKASVESHLGNDITHVVSQARKIRIPRSLGNRVLKIPSCFKDFDFHPEDCFALAERYVELNPGHQDPLTVIGIRTSGNYLGPLVAGYLRRRGFENVCLTSVRQRVPLFSRECRQFRRRSHPGSFLLIDDPPVMDLI